MLFFICVLIWLFLSCAKEMTGRNGFQDETLMTDEFAGNPDDRQMKCLFLDWGGLNK